MLCEFYVYCSINNTLSLSGLCYNIGLYFTHNKINKQANRQTATTTKHTKKQLNKLEQKSSISLFDAHLQKRHSKEYLFCFSNLSDPFFNPL